MTQTESLVKIIIVDDDSDDRDLITDLVEDELKEFIEISYATNYAEALEKVQTNNFDVCLFDYNLGKENGIELLKECREKGILTPVIFLTGQNNEVVAVQSREAGASDFFYKSKVNASSLCTSIRNTLGERDDLSKHILNSWKLSR